MTIKGIQTTKSSQQQCGRCGSCEIARSHRKNPFEFALSLVILPWRCRVCYNRFYRSRLFRPEPEPANNRSSEKASAAAA